MVNCIAEEAVAWPALPKIADPETALSRYITYVTYYNMPLLGSNEQMTMVIADAVTKPEVYYLESHGKNNDWICGPKGSLGETIVSDRERLIARYQ